MAWLGTRIGETQTRVAKGVQLIKFEKINPAEHSVYEQVEVGAYSHVTVLAETIAPPNGSATVAIFGDQNGAVAEKYEVSRLNSVANSWSRWDQENPGKHLSLVVSPPSQANTAPATEVEVRVYLSPR